VAALRALRTALARERRLPAYLIFHDVTLNALAAARPRTVDELRAIVGIGERKAETFGARILDVIGSIAAPVEDHT
jgi:ATP-dependent DNA helicase RecQ